MTADQAQYYLLMLRMGEGESLDPWQLQQEETRQKSLLGRLRDLIKPTVQ